MDTKHPENISISIDFVTKLNKYLCENFNPIVLINTIGLKFSIALVEVYVKIIFT